MSILCIDNSDTIRRVVEDCVLDLNYKFFEAENGQIGLEKAENIDDLRLVIIDWNMPVMSGKETLVQFRNMYPDVLLLVLIKFEKKDEVMLAIELGANDYMLKPFRVNELQNKIRDIIENAE
jgi:DNA-binding response OmpR family regulator